MTGHKLKTIAMLILDSELPEDEDEVAKPFYLYNPNGKATKKKEFYITRKEWEKKIKEWESEIVRVDFIPFANYKSKNEGKALIFLYVESKCYDVSVFNYILFTFLSH